MKKYITPAIECYEIEISTQILAGSNPQSKSFQMCDEDADNNIEIDARENNNSNMWESGW